MRTSERSKANVVFIRKSDNSEILAIYVQRS